MNRRAFSLLALLPVMQTKRIGGPNPGDCFAPWIQPEDGIAGAWFGVALNRWCAVAADHGVRTAYATLDPKHAALLPQPPVLMVAGVRVFVRVSDEPLPPHLMLGRVGWTIVAECGQTV